MRDAENINDVVGLGVDMIGMIFWKDSPRYVSSVPSRAGIIPDNANAEVSDSDIHRAKTVGVFVDAMPQEIVACVYNYQLDYVQLHGSETPTMIANLKTTLIPDIAPGIKVIKAIGVRTEDDLRCWRDYLGLADYLLFDTKCDGYGGSGEHFDWSILDTYDGTIPFLLSGGLDISDAEAIKSIHHPMLAGIDLNSRFELSPAYKDVEKIRLMLEKLK